MTQPGASNPNDDSTFDGPVSADPPPPADDSPFAVLADDALPAERPVTQSGPPADAVAYIPTDGEATVASSGEIEGEIRSGKLAGKSLAGAIAVLAIPIMLEQFANATVGLADQMIAGRLPEGIARAALDGVGIGVYVNWLINIAMSAMGVGGAAIIARGIGGGDRRLAHDALGQALTFGFFWGIIVGACMWIGAPLLAQIAHLTPEATAFCNTYIRTLAVGLPFTGLMLVAAMCMHGAGETTRPFFIVLAVSGINIVISWALAGADITIFGITFADPLGWKLDVFGIAIGTVVAKSIGTVLMLLLLVVGVRDLALEPTTLRPQPKMFKRIVRISIPGFFDGIGLWLGNIFVLAIIGEIAKTAGDGLQGAHAIAIRWESFSFLPGFAMGTAAGALAGQFLGAKNPRKAEQTIWICTIAGSVMMGLFGIGFMVGGEWLTRVVSSDPVHLRYAPQLLFICGLVQVPFALASVLRGGLRGVGDTHSTMIVTWVTTYLIRLPAAWIIGVEMQLGLIGVWYALCGELILRGAWFLLVFLRGKWKTFEV